jgi:hypothetical protein
MVRAPPPLRSSVVCRPESGDDPTSSSRPTLYVLSRRVLLSPNSLDTNLDEDKSARFSPSALQVYDPSIIRPLVATLHRLLSASSTDDNEDETEQELSPRTPPSALIASTIRNETTFARFIDEAGASLLYLKACIA